MPLAGRHVPRTLQELEPGPEGKLVPQFVQNTEGSSGVTSSSASNSSSSSSSSSSRSSSSSDSPSGGSSSSLGSGGSDPFSRDGWKVFATSCPPFKSCGALCCVEALDLAGTGFSACCFPHFQQKPALGTILAPQESQKRCCAGDAAAASGVSSFPPGGPLPPGGGPGGEGVGCLGLPRGASAGMRPDDEAASVLVLAMFTASVSPLASRAFDLLGLEGDVPEPLRVLRWLASTATASRRSEVEVRVLPTLPWNSPRA